MIFDGTNHDPIIVEDEKGTDTGWRIVGADPRQWRYADDDQEAMDFTNWDVLKGGMGEDTEHLLNHPQAFHIGYTYDREGEWDAWMSDEEASWVELQASEVIGLDAYSYDRGYNLGSNSVLIVREEWADGEETDEWAHYLDCARSLANYPLLDEDAYSALEYAAWMRCLDDWVIREVSEAAATDIGTDEWMPEGTDLHDLSDVIEAMSDEWVHDACQAMAYAYGFSGEYDEDGAVAHVVTWWNAHKLTFHIMADLGRYAMLDGQMRLTYT